MNGEPEQPGERPGEGLSSELGDRVFAADGGENALVAVTERRQCRLPADDGTNHFGNMFSGLNGDGRDAGQILILRKIADGKCMGMIGEAKVFIDQEAAGPIFDGVDGMSNIGCLDSRGPNNGCRFDALLADLQKTISDLGDSLAQSNVDAKRAQAPQRALRKPLGECAQHPLSSFDQDDFGRGRINPVKVGFQGGPSKFGKGTRQLDSSRASTDNRDAHEATLLCPIVDGFGALKAVQHVIPNANGIVQCLEFKDVRAPGVAAEERRGRAGGDNDEVIVDGPQVRHHAAIRQVDAFHRRQQYFGVAKLPDHLSNRHGNVGGRQPGRRYLIKERREEKVVVAIKNGDPDGRAAQSLRNGHASKPSANDHDVRSAVPTHHCPFHLQCSGTFLGVETAANESGDTIKPSVPIRLIALDLDGTTLRSDRTMHPENAAAIQRAHESGIFVVAASGRFAPSIDQHLTPLGVPFYTIAANGAHVRDSEGADMAIEAISHHLVSALHDYAEEFDVHLNVYTPHQIHMLRPTEWQHVYIERLGSDRHICRGSSIREIIAPIKAMLIDAPDHIQRHAHAIQERFDLTDVTVVESEPDYLEFISKKAGKGEALKTVAKALGVSRLETAAIGDFLNDYEMVAWAGIGAAVANAHPEVRAAADLIAPHHDDAGVAWFIDTVIQRNASLETSATA